MEIHSCIPAIWLVVCITLVFGHQNQQFGQPPQQQHAHGQQQPHGGHVPSGGAQQHQGGQMFDKSNVQDREHIKEHLEGVIQQPDTSKMTEQELQFHYFKMHDNDNNNKLDGTELIKSLIHWHDTDGEEPEAYHQEARIMSDSELTNMVDSIFDHDDTNNDGYLDWAEYIAAQQAVN